MRRRFGLRLLVLLGLTLGAIAASSCGYQLSQVAVENQSAEVIVVADSQLPCDAHPNLKDLHSHLLAPGEQRQIVTFTGKYVGDSCLFVADLNGRPAVANIQHKALYGVTKNGDSVEMAVVGENENGFDFNISVGSPPLWFLAVFVAPLAAGALVALLITVSFFYGYYVQGKR